MTFCVDYYVNFFMNYCYFVHKYMLKKYFRFLVVCCLNVPFFTVSMCAANQEPTMPKAPYVLSQVVKEWQAQGKAFTLVDVREKEEYDVGHLPGAINIPYAEVEERLEDFDKEQTYVIYCIHSSWRAPYVANLLADYEYDNIYVLEGGVSAWNAGGQVVYPKQAQKQNDEIEIAPYPKNLTKSLKHPPAREYKVKINLTLEQLAEFDGQNGRSAYVAVNGVIYDVTNSRLWRGGEHDPAHGRAMAGQDLTEVLKHNDKHGIEALQKFPVVGNLVR